MVSFTSPNPSGRQLKYGVDWDGDLIDQQSPHCATGRLARCVESRKRNMLGRSRFINLVVANVPQCPFAGTAAVTSAMEVHQ